MEHIPELLLSLLFTLSVESQLCTLQHARPRGCRDREPCAQIALLPMAKTAISRGIARHKGVRGLMEMERHRNE